MKLLKILGQLLYNIRRNHNAARELKRAKHLDNLSCESINVLEFDGRLYIAFNGAPVVRLEDLKITAPELLAKSRVDYLAWKKKFNV